MRLLLILMALALAACDPQIIERTVYVTAEAPAVAPEVTAPDVPAWAPLPLHVYVLDAADAILVDETETADSYGMRLYMWGLTAELQTRDFPAEPWHVVGGGLV